MAKAKVEVTGHKVTKCEIDRDRFQEKAKPMLMRLTGGNIPEGESVAIALGVSKHKADDGSVEFGFSSGSFGWGASEKITIVVDGVPLKIQGGINLVVVNSKDAS